MPWTDFHPAVQAWFSQAFAAPTQAQRQAWPAIKSGRHTLIAAPTGSGKTLAAFLAVIDDLVWRGLEQDLFGRLEDRTYVVYVSPLRALSNDIRKNLELPLAGIEAALQVGGLGGVGIRTAVRTGDTPAGERERMRRRPPHILVTTPESLYLLLTSDSGRRMLSSVSTVIVDEIHALAGNKRGAHLTLSLERLQALCAGPLTRIGLSATQRPLTLVSSFLTGAAAGPCTVVDSGHAREWDIGIELPDAPLEAVMSGEVWQELYDRLARLIRDRRTTLLFVNTRRQAERLAKALAERMGEAEVSAHHGSLSREHRLEAEARLKAGALRALVATASLELGIDIGDVDLVCQIGSPRAIATFVQRVGRSGHGVGRVPVGRLFPTSRDDLVECVALLEAVHGGELDALAVPAQPLDVLAQQIVAEVSGGEWATDALYELVRRAWPYRDLERQRFDAVVTMVAEGFSTRRGRRGAWLHWDRVNGRLRPGRAARLVALLNGGAIPDLFDYDVVLQPGGTFVGTLNEDFAFESLPGDIFQLGNTAYRILKTTGGKVHVEDARGQPPNIPFWFGEAPGRSDELSEAVSRLRRWVDTALDEGSRAETVKLLSRRTGTDRDTACAVVDYLATARAALGRLPTQEAVVLERFFDEAGDQHLVVHSCFGSRVNRAWGLALRKRFCRKFNFELQAAALEDAIVLSLGPTHSFPLDEVGGYLRSASVRALLVQALLDAPMFATHWRWNATIALAVQRNRTGRRVPPQLQRMDAEDLLAVVFPDQLACLENIAGNREIPEHPLVDQTLYDCLNEVMDVGGLERLLSGIEEGRIEIHSRDLAGPSPLAQEVLTAHPYAFLDDAPAEERRTQMVQTRRFGSPGQAAILGSLDKGAIERVRSEAWPLARSPDELHDALMLLGLLSAAEGERLGAGGGRGMLEALSREHRAAELQLPGGARVWVCAERWPLLHRVHPGLERPKGLAALPIPEAPSHEEAVVELVRARLLGVGPVGVADLAGILGLDSDRVQAGLMALQSEGFALCGHYSGAAEQEWCERGLLARIHRYTLHRLRREIEPVDSAGFMRFLLHWHGLVEGDERGEGEQALARVLTQLEGYGIAAGAWETEVLPARLSHYDPSWLDGLCASGRFMWLRLASASAPRTEGGRGRAGPIRSTPITLLERIRRPYWQGAPLHADLSSPAQRVLACLKAQGATFFAELLMACGLLPAQLEAALAELAALGLASSDSFAGLRSLICPPRRGRSRGRQQHKGRGLDGSGRWAWIGLADGMEVDPEERIEHMARVLLRRYGVVSRAMLAREPQAPPWRELIRVYRRLEDRGELRGGRFVAGVGGEQFALSDAVGLLRELRRRRSDGELVVLSAIDPLNLSGVVSAGERIPAITGNRIAYRDGVPVAVATGGRIRGLGAAVSSQVRAALIRDRRPARHYGTGGGLGGVR